MVLDLFVLGCGGMLPLPGRHLTSLLLRREGELFLFDCGEGTQVSLRSLNLRWKKINAIFITHTHADHVTGLPGMLMLSAQVDREEPLRIIGPPRIREFVESSRASLEMHINYEIIVEEINPTKPGVVYRGDGYEVRSFPVKHSRPTVGYVFEESPRPGVFHPERADELAVPRGPLWAELQRGSSVTLDDGSVVRSEQVLGNPRRGRKFTFATDSLPIDTIASEAANSDLFICEGMFESALAESAHEKKHMTAREAGRLAAKAGGVKSMGLIHYSPRYTNRELRILEDEAKDEFPAAFLTRDRQHIEIPYPDEVHDEA